MAATIPEVAGVRLLPTRRMIMDEVTFHREPPVEYPNDGDGVERLD